jgi:hypothetical protein
VKSKREVKKAKLVGDCIVLKSKKEEDEGREVNDSVEINLNGMRRRES